MLKAVALVETPVEAQVTPAAVPEAAQALLMPPALSIRGEKRKREDELLVRYEQMQGLNARLELSSSISVPLGTLDGMLARARKRRKERAL